MAGDTSEGQAVGRKGAVPISTTFRSNSQRLNDSVGASIPEISHSCKIA